MTVSTYRSKIFHKLLFESPTNELEFVGKVVSEKGLQISRTKIQSVLDFPLPTVSKQLKSFLGTANYLRDFVRDYSKISQPLHQLLTDYNKTRRVVWTPELTAPFHEMKLAISKCTTMYFMSGTAPITSHTNASDYGISGYLFQTVDGKDQPVAFVSKSLNKSQLRWYSQVSFKSLKRLSVRSSP